MDWDVIAPMVFAIILTLTIGGVILLKPIANKLGHLLEAMAKERSQPQLHQQLDHMRDLLETTSARLALLEERQEFTEALFQERKKGAGSLGAGVPEAGSLGAGVPEAGSLGAGSPGVGAGSDPSRASDRSSEGEDRTGR